MVILKRSAKILCLCLALLIGLTLTLGTQTTLYDAHAATIKISKTKVTLVKGKSTTLKVTGTKTKPKWSTSKRSVATVNSSGKVTAKNVGTATVTAKVGQKKLTCKVTVKKAPDYKNLIVGMWQGDWGYSTYAQFEFTKSGHFYFTAYDKYGSNSTEGRYWVKGDKLQLDTGETYTIKSINKGVLTIKTYWGTFKLDSVYV